MGRCCGVCGQERPHEHFGGRGQLARICRNCRRKPLEVRMRALWTGEIIDFLDQSNISAKNLKRLKAFESEAIEEVSVLASSEKTGAEVGARSRASANKWPDNRYPRTPIWDNYKLFD